MKKQYINPSTATNSVASHSQLLAASTIGRGSKTNDFDVKDNEFEDEEPYNPWYSQEE